MKLEAFKKILKEVVKDAVREELSVILNTEVGSPITETKRKPEVGYSSISAILEDTKRAMSPGEYKTLAVSLDPESPDNPLLSSPFNGHSVNEGPVMNHAPVRGVDISKLDFVKVAKEKLALMEEKQKQRYGI